MSRGSLSADGPLSRHGEPTSDWRGTTTTTSEAAPAAPSSFGTGSIERAQLWRVGVVMCAYGLFYTLLAGNQTVASLAAVRHI